MPPSTVAKSLRGSITSKKPYQVTLLTAENNPPCGWVCDFGNGAAVLTITATAAGIHGEKKALRR